MPTRTSATPDPPDAALSWNRLPRRAGSGAAAGRSSTEPLAPGDGDAAFVDAWTRDLLPAVEAFRPEAILVSAGYDAHAADLLANLEVTERGYEAVALALGGVARRLGLPGIALTLEGGYDLDALRASVAATVRGLLAGMAGARDAARRRVTAILRARTTGRR